MPIEKAINFIADLFREKSPQHPVIRHLQDPLELVWTVESVNVINLVNDTRAFERLEQHEQWWVMDRAGKVHSMQLTPEAHWVSLNKEQDGLTEYEFKIPDRLIAKIGVQGWNWKKKQTEFIGADLDSIAGHARGLSDEKLAEYTQKRQDSGKFNIVPSKSGKGQHDYVWLNAPWPAATKEVHSAQCQAAYHILADALGIPIKDIDKIGGTLWVWAVDQVTDAFKPTCVSEYQAEAPPSFCTNTMLDKAKKSKSRSRQLLKYEHASKKHRDFLAALPASLDQDRYGNDVFHCHSVDVAKHCQKYGLQFDPQSSDVGDGKPNGYLRITKQGFKFFFFKDDPRKPQTITLIKNAKTSRDDILSWMIESVIADYTLTKTHAGDLIAVEKQGTPPDHHALEPGGYLQDKLISDAHAHHGQLISDIKSVFSVLRMRAEESGNEVGVGKRVYLDPDGHYYFHTGDSVCLDFHGEVIKRHSPANVVFNKTPIVYQPDLDNGDISLLRPYCPMLDDLEFDKFKLSVLASLLPLSEYPITEIIGPYGSAKTGLLRIWTMIGDPMVDPVCKSPIILEAKSLSSDDLAIIADQRHVIAIDNLGKEKAQGKIQDRLCIMATGGNSATRVLYTTDRYKTFRYLNPVCVAALESPFTQPDLRSRILTINARKIKQEATNRWYSRFLEDLPKISGGFLNAVRRALINYPNTPTSNACRMPEFATYCEAAELGISSISKILQDNQQNQAAKAFGENGQEFVDALRAVCDFNGPAGELSDAFAILDVYSPKSIGRWLGREQNQLQLQQVGIQATKDDRRWILKLEA